MNDPSLRGFDVALYLPPMANPPGDHSHLIDFPEALEALFSRIGELKLVLGAAAEPGLNEVERLLRAGLAARGRGDPGAAVAHIAQGMDRLAAIASSGDPREGALMRAVAERFRQALVRGAVGEAQEAADVMRERSGSVVRPKKGR